MMHPHVPRLDRPTQTSTLSLSSPPMADHDEDETHHHQRPPSTSRKPWRKNEPLTTKRRSSITSSPSSSSSSSSSSLPSLNPLAVSNAAIVGHQYTLRCINGFKYQRRCHKLTLGLTTEKLRFVKTVAATAVGEEEISAAAAAGDLEVSYQEPSESYLGKFKEELGS
ncbi:hypothetical protein HID58_079384 [Brassica napus]|uniref:Uncharacterized protein n=1 Tax=Brassica napus TaxID=3708 RepID=A0ABQ7Y1W3_BRANA|nr:hypothetical protein HID58_079384 [Brassica napus]